MDDQLKRLIRLNEAKREFYDTGVTTNSEFSIFEIFTDAPLKPVEVSVIEQSRERIKDGRNSL